MYLHPEEAVGAIDPDVDPQLIQLIHQFHNNLFQIQFEIELAE